MLLGGVQIDDRLVRVLAELVGGTLGRKLELALLLRSRVFGLTTPEKNQLLAKLDQTPDELENIQETLIASWRRQQRLTANDASMSVKGSASNVRAARGPDGAQDEPRRAVAEAAPGSAVGAPRAVTAPSRAAVRIESQAKSTCDTLP